MLFSMTKLKEVDCNRSHLRASISLIILITTLSHSNLSLWEGEQDNIAHKGTHWDLGKMMNSLKNQKELSIQSTKKVLSKISFHFQICWRKIMKIEFKIISKTWKKVLIRKMIGSQQRRLTTWKREIEMRWSKVSTQYKQVRLRRRMLKIISSFQESIINLMLKLKHL